MREVQDTSTVEKTLNPDGEESSNVVDEDQKPEHQTDEHQEMDIQNDEAESNGDKDTTKKTSDVKDDEVICAVRKLFVHSQWLSVQSTYFKALFYSGMKETYSKEVVMKIYEHELEAHLVLIEAMYKPDVLKDKNYHLIVQVLILANKYDVSLLIKKCKSVLTATTPSLKMSEYILQETEHLTEMALVYDMLQTFLVKEFSPFDEIWTTKKFTDLSEAAVRLLLKSDELATQSENTIFVALMKWVRSNISHEALHKCDLLDVVKFEFMSINFLYDVVRHNFFAKMMPGFTANFQKGLAYHGFSEMRREQLKAKPKKRPATKGSGPTFSWVIDDKVKEKLKKFPKLGVISDKFWHHGYPMRLHLTLCEDSSKCSLYLAVIGLKDEACLYINFKAKSSFFGSKVLKGTEWLYTGGGECWGYDDVECNQSLQTYTIDLWIELV